MQPVQFTPTKDFYSKETRSQYCAGLTYSVKPGNVLLEELVPQWFEAGLVNIGAPVAVPAKAKVSGAGKIT